ncbi:hypothetical protein CCH79_00018274 [Gambusia affinis]|uniref:Uncharacterized protein n=1 Tax=Gambusia affinis TaxID=33528 RepID=A0A315W084_GAMAF|nr:hypothetical protein CCH79_00018274 [Gambusia affinis]
MRQVDNRKSTPHELSVGDPSDFYFTNLMLKEESCALAVAPHHFYAGETSVATRRRGLFCISSRALSVKLVRISRSSPLRRLCLVLEGLVSPQNPEFKPALCPIQTPVSGGDNPLEMRPAGRSCVAPDLQEQCNQNRTGQAEREIYLPTIELFLNLIFHNCSHSRGNVQRFVTAGLEAAVWDPRTSSSLFEFPLCLLYCREETQSTENSQRNVQSRQQLLLNSDQT